MSRVTERSHVESAVRRFLTPCRSARRKISPQLRRCVGAAGIPAAQPDDSNGLDGPVADRELGPIEAAVRGSAIGRDRRFRHGSGHAAHHLLQGRKECRAGWDRFNAPAAKSSGYCCNAHRPRVNANSKYWNRDRDGQRVSVQQMALSVDSSRPRFYPILSGLVWSCHWPLAILGSLVVVCLAR